MTTALIQCFDCHRPVVRSEPLWMLGQPYGPKCGARYGLRHEPKPRVRARRPKTGAGEQPSLFDPPETENEIEINEEELT